MDAATRAINLPPVDPTPPPSSSSSNPPPKRASNELPTTLRPPPPQPPATENPRNPTSRPESPAYDSIPIDGAGEDELLRHSEFLSREEVLRRRSRRLRQLVRLYKDQYWALIEELRLRHREYYWRYGKSPLVEKGGRNAGVGGGGLEAGFERGEKRKRKGEGVVEFRRCMFSGCKMKAMALTTYCIEHILSDQRQTLYKACTYVIKSAQSGAIVCGKPVLRSTVPLFCAFHFRKAQKHLSQALKKAVLNNTSSSSSSSRIAPKVHEIVYKLTHHARLHRMKLKSTDNGEVENDAYNQDNKHVN